MTSKDEWAFDQRLDTSALTTRQILEGIEPIRQVVHYSDDNSWAFTHGTSDQKEDFRVVHMWDLIKLDQTLHTISDLQPGWSAWRDRVGDDWERIQEDIDEF